MTKKLIKTINNNEIIFPLNKYKTVIIPTAEGIKRKVKWSNSVVLIFSIAFNFKILLISKSNRIIIPRTLPGNAKAKKDCIRFSTHKINNIIPSCFMCLHLDVSSPYKRNNRVTPAILILKTVQNLGQPTNLLYKFHTAQ